ncbi:MAG: nucleoside triphosphate pyrophosphohydrolase [Oscillospiraceae bacterium]|nr:nucleoside triphosphate pyrophosphohydrolase [Oscillospiraceae bacterium]
MEFEFKERYDINDLIEIMRILRSEEGCPWDKVQTHSSIRMDMIEECYEACEAIDEQDSAHLREELGDVLLQVVFHAQIEAEQGNFDFSDTVNDVAQKLVYRHPHVFGDVKADTVGEALSSWNDMKQKSHGQETYTDTLKGVSRAFPALMRAQKVGKRAKRAGMDLPDAEAALKALESEIEEFRSADAEHEAEELGDMLFSAVNVVRLRGYDAEELLTRATEKFIRRFEKTEELLRCEGRSMCDLDIDTLDTYWQRAKNEV